MIKNFLTIIFLLLFSNNVFAGESENFDNFKLIGKAELKFIGFKLYDIEVKGENENFSYDQKFIIKITYNKSFSKEDLVETSISEIARINDLEPKAVEEQYKNKFESLFVNVKKGDEKIAFYDPKFGLKLFFNGTKTSQVKDVIFARRFVDIWLSDKAKFKKVRDKLIGLNK